MTRRIVSSALALVMAAAFVPFIFAGQLEDAKPEINFYGMHRLRYESGDNYFDFNDAVNDSYSFWPTRTLIGMQTMLARDVWAKVEVQNFGSFGNQSPDRSAVTMNGFPAVQNLDGVLDDQGDHNSDISIYRAIVGLDKIGGSSFSAAFGRQEYTVGGSMIFGSEPFYNGTVFDGLTGWYDFDSWKLRGVYFVTQERNDPSDDDFFSGTFGNEDVTVYGFDATLPLGDGEGNNWGDVQPYIYMKDDGQEVADPNFSGGGFGAHLEEMVYGAWWGRDVDTVALAKANPMSWGIEIAIQDGDELNATDPNQTDDFSGWMMEGNFGWNFLSHDRIIHRPAVGFISQAGDDDTTDSDITGWSSWWGDIHCRFGCADWFSSNFESFGAGITGMWAGYTVMTNPGRHKAWLKYWSFSPTEDSVDDGNPATSDDVDDYGTEIDLGYTYGYSANTKLFFNLAQFSPDDGLIDLVSSTPNHDDEVLRLYGGLYLKFK